MRFALLALCAAGHDHPPRRRTLRAHRAWTCVAQGCQPAARPTAQGRDDPIVQPHSHWRTVPERAPWRADARLTRHTRQRLRSDYRARRQPMRRACSLAMKPLRAATGTTGAEFSEWVLFALCLQTIRVLDKPLAPRRRAPAKAHPRCATPPRPTVVATAMPPCAAETQPSSVVRASQPRCTAPCNTQAGADDRRYLERSGAWSTLWWAPRRNSWAARPEIHRNTAPARAKRKRSAIVYSSLARAYAAV